MVLNRGIELASVVTNTGCRDPIGHQVSLGEDEVYKDSDVAQAAHGNHTDRSHAQAPIRNARIGKVMHDFAGH